MKANLTKILVLAVALIAAIAIAVACASGRNDDGGGKTDGTVELAYELNADSDGYCVIGVGNVEDTSLVIPSTYDGKPVVAIGKGAFENCAALTSVTIPSSVITVGENAFAGCTSLEDVNYGGDFVAWSKIEFANEQANPLLAICKANGTDLVSHKLTAAELIESFRTLISAENGNLQAFSYGVRLSLVASEVLGGSHTAVELQKSVSALNPENAEHIGFQISQLYGLYLFEEFDNDNVTFKQMLDYAVKASDTDEGKIFIDEQTRSDLLEFADAIDVFLREMDRYVSKSEFQDIVQDMLGSSFAIKVAAGTVFSSCANKYGDNGSGKVHLIKLMDYAANEAALTSNIIDSDSKQMLNNAVFAFNAINNNCKYDEFLPLMKRFVYDLTGEEREISATDEDVQQIYIMYFREQNAIPDTAVNGSELTVFADNVLATNSAVAKLISEQDGAVLRDALKIKEFISSDEKLGYKDMTVAVNGLFGSFEGANIDGEISESAVMTLYCYSVLNDK